jgi:hypothetical protein
MCSTQARRRAGLTPVREKVVTVGANVVFHARSTVLQMAEVAAPRNLFRRTLETIGDLRQGRPLHVDRCQGTVFRPVPTGELRPPRRKIAGGPACGTCRGRKRLFSFEW